ncbi:ABC transporter ATP-binding protein [Permianibacter aggregans]|uniref:ABC-2 type transport system ATP-binding protein n=1 Tax=Permianibacter aggregans TaxID=1510150 RepID=A0A4R6UV92_9GAMM|nr:ABC transporter ATP-binding protein [Permianibacter aggregans]TDQ49859.1 ABC-2 type transport system ATP-binding protein [Permianibacter aggregans]
MDLVLADRARCNSNAIIRLNDIRYAYPGASENALNGVSLALHPGRILGLLGPNGAGKSTLISIITGMRKAASGEWYSSAKRVSLVPQDFAFYPSLTVAENLKFFSRMTPTAAPAESLAKVIDIAQLGAFLNKQAAQLSGGMKRRLNLAIGLLAEPDVLLLDEPTVGVDPQSRAYLLNAVRELAATGISVLYTSHYMDEVQAICDEVAIVDRGVLLANGSVAELLQQQSSEVVFTLSEFEQLDWSLAPTPLLARERDEFRFACAQSNTISELCQWFTAQGAQIIAMRRGHQHLEQVFMQLTHHRLRD